ncbi:phosphotransferase [Nocardioides sediminis]|uniref:phosphotransferase n=1 Tax=Nocardioides sediminis TaxID=433648 RepID=UPI00131F0807|nr:phosphotransferase [Nocardioides sediminis]
MSQLHSDELSIDVPLVRRLVDRAFPEYAGHDLVPTRDSGSSNALFRLGEDMQVRLPRQPGGGATIDKEARWLPFVGSRITFAVPTVLGIGEPDLGYSERWEITHWLDGASAAPPRPGWGNSAPAGLATRHPLMPMTAGRQRRASTTRTGISLCPSHSVSIRGDG